MASVELGYSTFYQVRDVEFSRHGGDIGSIPQLKFIANSEFTRERIKESFGKNAAIVLPPIAQERCRVPQLGNRVLMINPDPSKGGDIALELAAQCPDIPFLIQESWASNKHLVEMKRAAKKLSNVQWEPPKIDIRKAFSRAKIILVPSKCEEAWGRVVSEAQVSGIPAVACRIGGLPESVGAGGILVDVSSDISNWEVALRSLWDSPETFQKYSKAALDHANRPQAQPSYQAMLLCEALENG
ncbi:MAG: glycosyltransferase [Lacipirellulaceae bacterium]